MRIFLLSNNEMNFFEYKSAHMDMTCRSSHQRCFVEKVVLKFFANFTGKFLWWSVFLTKFVKNFVKKIL